MLTAEQLCLQISDEAWAAIPDAPRRRPVGRPPRAPRQRRPRIEARHRLALSGYVPAVVGCGFTDGETAVLAIFAIEHKKHGKCDLTQGMIGRAANASRTVVQNTLYWAERRGHIKVERSKTGKASETRNRPNIITIIDPTWLAWLRLGPAKPRPWGGGTASPQLVVGTVLRALRHTYKKKDLRNKESFDEMGANSARSDAHATVATGLDAALARLKAGIHSGRA